MFNIGNVELKNPIIIAPMAGISNGAFRSICYEFGAALTCAEMVSDKAIFYDNKRTMKMLEVDDQFHPISLQIFGSDIDTMVNAAKVIDKDTNADIIDINMGCPVNKVIKTGSGSALMKDEDKAVGIVKNIVENVKKPVTVKMRLGFDNNHLNFLSLSKKLEEVGVKAITLHARTRSQMYEGNADWSKIKELKENLRIPVIGNGDVKKVEDFIRMREECKVDGVMIGRGSIGNPFLIKEIDNYLKGQKEYTVTYEDRISYCLKHALKLMDLKGEEVGIKEMRSLAPHYIAGLPSCTFYKAKMSTLASYRELEELLMTYKHYLSICDI